MGKKNKYFNNKHGASWSTKWAEMVVFAATRFFKTASCFDARVEFLQTETFKTISRRLTLEFGAHYLFNDSLPTQDFWSQWIFLNSTRLVKSLEICDLSEMCEVTTAGADRVLRTPALQASVRTLFLSMTLCLTRFLKSVDISELDEIQDQQQRSISVALLLPFDQAAVD